MVDKILKDYPKLSNFLCDFSSARDVLILYRIRPNQTFVSQEEADRILTDTIDQEVVVQYVKIYKKDDIIDVLQEGKALLEMAIFPSDDVSTTCNMYFDDEKNVKPWVLSMLKILEEESIKQGISIPVELQNLWKS